MLTIGIRYLNGFAVAAEPSDRQQPEWPPHPGRVFMALAAAYFQTGKNAKEREALEWLEKLPPPAMRVNDHSPRWIVEQFVPVNDKSVWEKDPAKKDQKPPPQLQSAPGIMRVRQPRTFASAWVGDEAVYLIWRDASPSDEQRQALEQLCLKVTRIGHSISLVQVWLCSPAEADALVPNWVPDNARAEITLRIPAEGTLSDLERRFNAQECDEYATLKIEAADETDKKRQREARRKLREKFKNQPPPRLRPALSLYQGYARPMSTKEEKLPKSSVFSPYLLVWTLERIESDYRELDLLCTLTVTARWREALISQSNAYSQEVRSLVSGHDANKKPLESPHVAFLPLAFVGHPYADAHLLGVALALPADVNPAHRHQLLGLAGRVTELKLGRLGRWRLVRENSIRPARNLQIETWAGREPGATHWATVTPIALDRHPKAKNRYEYQVECSASIAQTCQTVGLPVPREVIVTSVSAHLGVPPAHAFPRLTRKDGSERQHTHAILVFGEPVRGPILLGAGRYRGYGFCRPLSEDAL